ncbi:phage tail assembly protein [Erwinia mallotivora]|uniref:phage tail assembly protein n=1 Tax=Erwinia mallotivora TaxID=69222 RepID=UPI0021BDF69F|nr:phage tail assembly protein [Erwinia mallotivora]
MENKENVVTLQTPVMRGEQAITTVEIIKPNAGALRGTRLADLAGSDVDALIVVLPRITLPTLTKAECMNLDPADLIALAGQVIGFLSPKSDA